MTRQAKAIPGELVAKRSFWRKQIARWERSGQAQRRFCAKHGLALSKQLAQVLSQFPVERLAPQLREISNLE